MLDGFQYLEERDASDKITRAGVVSKKSAFVSPENAGIYDAIAKDLRLLAEAVTSLDDDTDLQQILTQVKSMYNDMRTNPNFGSTAARAAAEDALKQARAAATSAESAKEYGDKAASVAATITAVENCLKTIDALQKSTADNATIATNKANFIVEHEKAAAASASAAASSESAAKTSETNASNSQTAAASSASSASTSATKASDHETNAKTALASCQTIQTQVNAGLQSLTSAVKYRGSVVSFADLPTSDLSVGDMYNVKAAGGTDSNGTAIKAGDNVVYNGDGWDDQSGTIDLSDCPKNEDVAKAVTSANVANDTITLIHKDATKTTLIVDNVCHATVAEQDAKGQEIDIAAIKTLITTTVNDAVLATKQAIFPVGSIYISMTDSRNPAEILGFGTWEALPAGHSLVAVGTATETHGDTTKTFTFAAGKTYGEFEHQLTVGELARHDHSMYREAGSNAHLSGYGISGSRYDTNDYCYGQIGSTGNNEYHNNLTPCITTYIWRRLR